MISTEDRDSILAMHAARMSLDSIASTMELPLAEVMAVVSPPEPKPRVQLASPARGGWTEARVEVLQRRFQAGDSFAQIARALGGGISRSACIGKATRLGLERTRDRSEVHRLASKFATAENTVLRSAFNPAFKPRAPVVKRDVNQNSGINLKAKDFRPPRQSGDAALAAFNTAPPATAVAVADVEHRHCRWPFGDPSTPDFRFCGHARVKGDYCEQHAGRAYIPISPEKRAAEVETLMRLMRTAR